MMDFKKVINFPLSKFLLFAIVFAGISLISQAVAGIIFVISIFLFLAIFLYQLDKDKSRNFKSFFKHLGVSFVSFLVYGIICFLIVIIGIIPFMLIVKSDTNLFNALSSTSDVKLNLLMIFCLFIAVIFIIASIFMALIYLIGLARYVISKKVEDIFDLKNSFKIAFSADFLQSLFFASGFSFIILMFLFLVYTFTSAIINLTPLMIDIFPFFIILFTFIFSGIFLASVFELVKNSKN
ncbi:MAG: hypothetical protein V1824_02450 [archaeon]